jgi:hypothetical protein
MRRKSKTFCLAALIIGALFVYVARVAYRVVLGSNQSVDLLKYPDRLGQSVEDLVRTAGVPYSMPIKIDAAEREPGRDAIVWVRFRIISGWDAKKLEDSLMERRKRDGRLWCVEEARYDLSERIGGLEPPAWWQPARLDHPRAFYLNTAKAGIADWVVFSPTTGDVLLLHFRT